MAQCNLCPILCELSVGQIGTCKVRIGDVVGSKLLTYGMISTALVGPIEQKPIFHFMPGLRILSIGGTGCNMVCKYCQNFEVSQVGKSGQEYFSPHDITAMAISKGAQGIAFTYSEPLIWYEYVRDVAIAAREAGLKTILKTNGFCNAQKFKEIASLMDAINIDAKGGPRSYKEICGIEACDVIFENMNYASKHSHLEASLILIPGYEDELSPLLVRILDACGPSIPIHLLRFIPDFKMRDVSPTSFEAMHSAQVMALKLFKHVYLGYSGAKNITRCSSCLNVLVYRDGLSVEQQGFCGNKLKYCQNCHAPHDMICQA